jgi:hypothetical protein
MGLRRRWSGFLHRPQQNRQASFGGVLAEIAWIGQYDSVGQYDEMRTKVLSDGEYRAALKKARDLFTPGSDRDQIWKHTL